MGARFAVAALLALGVCAEAAQLQPADPDAGGTLTVHVDAVVTDTQGRPLDALKPTDFEIIENGSARAIGSARYVKPAQGVQPPAVSPILSRAEEQAAAHDEMRLVAVFLDDYHVAAGDTARAREIVARVLARLTPRDLVIVVRPLDSLVSLRLTHDLRGAAAAVDGFEGRKGEYTPRNNYERNFMAADPARAEPARAQIVASALNALAVHLGGLNAARKTLVVVSEGFGLASRRRFEAALPTVDTIVRSANRGGVTIYSIDPSTEGADPSAATVVPVRTATEQGTPHAALVALANGTGGATVLTSGETAAWERRLTADWNGYYVLSFPVAAGQDRGGFHPVSVRVRKPGAVVVARPGYWTADAEDKLAARLVAFENRPKPPAEPPLHVSTLIRPWFGVARGDQGRMRVTFVWQAADQTASSGPRTRTPALVSFKAIQNGVPIFTALVKPAGASPGDRSDVPAQAVFDTAPGRVRVELTIQDAASRVLDVDTRDVSVKPIDGQVALGAALILRARSAREFREIATDADAVPVATRTFSRTERLLVRIPAYSTGDAPAVFATLLSRTSAVLRDLTVTSGPTAPMFQVDLPLAALANGDYIVKVAASAGGSAASTDIPIKVAP